MRWLPVLALALLLWAGVRAEPVPEWLDTTAPVVEVTPDEMYHPEVFLVSLRANEEATIWVARNESDSFEIYRKPLTVSEEGRTVFRYYAEDGLGNKSSVDSTAFVIDTRSPRLSVDPPPGRYRGEVTVTVSANEPCAFFVRFPPGDSLLPTQPVFDVAGSFEGTIVAVDSAGNRTSTAPLRYQVDSVRIDVRISPAAGVYSEAKRISFTASEGAHVHYAFDPLAPPDWFKEYEKPVRLPYGLTVVRYFGESEEGWRGEILKTTYVIDTVPPQIKMERIEGTEADTLILSTREPSTIRYFLDKERAKGEGERYRGPIAIPREGIGRLRALARDSAGNHSPLFTWQHRYDKIPPVISISKPSGTYTDQFEVRLSANEPARFFYTLDGSEPDEKSPLYKGGILISREGKTVLRCKGIDEAANVSEEKRAEYVLDTRPPEVEARIEGDVDTERFTVKLRANEPVRIYYETGGRTPGEGSAVYRDGIPMRQGEVLKYLAVDEAGNRGRIETLDELRKPMVSAMPRGGMYNRRLNIQFKTSGASRVYWRILPDTAFRPYVDSLIIEQSGTYTLEYYSETETGLSSTLRREEYSVDLLPPQVKINVRKGAGDTAYVLFQADENASIYYTVDGSNPAYSTTTRMAGNKFTRSSDRIKIRRSADVQLAFFAEDVAGNQSSISVLDVFKPRAVPNVPDGTDRVYDRILSVAFSTFDRAQIYYSRHGNTPTVDSSVYREPITLVQSDTICAFVVDASGFVGDLDTFVYLIDLPPSPRFTVSPTVDSVNLGQSVSFDASGTIDYESPLEKLEFRWDFEGDGTFDTEFGPRIALSHAYAKPGLYEPTVEVRDEKERTATASRELRVRDACPPGMEFVVAGDGSTFCIDRYEWPNVEGEEALTGVSWVEAKMYCLDAGKRLCTAKEWASACRGTSKQFYPYGVRYDPERCPTRGEEPYVSGSFEKCGEGFGVRDMIGNVWEWTNDKEGDYPLMAGGSHKMGENAHCGLLSEGTVATEAADVGFRCCK